MAGDGVDPRLVPQRVLYTGAKMPAIGLGTFGSDHASHAEVAAAVRGAAEVGYRHFDCAAVYRNEDLIGAALEQVMASGVPREELWITSKLVERQACRGRRYSHIPPVTGRPRA